MYTYHWALSELPSRKSIRMRLLILWQCYCCESLIPKCCVLLCVCMLIRFRLVQLFATYGLQPPRLLSMGFSRQKYWSGLPCPPPEDLPNSGIKPASLTSPALAGKFFTISATWEALCLLPASIKPQLTTVLADKEDRLSVSLQYFFKYCRYQLYLFISLAAGHTGS